MLPRGPAVQLVDPDLLPAQVVRVPRVVLDVKPEISRALLGFLHGGVRQEEAERERDRGGKEGEIVRTQVLIVMCAVAFMGLCQKNCASGAKNSRQQPGNYDCGILVFLSSFSFFMCLAFTSSQISNSKDVLMKYKSPTVNKCKVHGCSLLQQQYSIYTVCPGPY